MEHFKELQKILSYQQEIKEYIKRVKTIDFIGASDYIGITDDSNRRYTICGVGIEKLNNIIEQFEGLINVELQKEKEKSEEEVSKFKLIKIKDLPQDN